MDADPLKPATRWGSKISDAEAWKGFRHPLLTVVSIFIPGHAQKHPSKENSYLLSPLLFGLQITFSLNMLDNAIAQHMSEVKFYYFCNMHWVTLTKYLTSPLHVHSEVG